MQIEATSCSMLSGVKRNDPDAWQRFFDRYKVLVFLRGKHYGFSEADTDDLLSRVMAKCFSPTGLGGKVILAFDATKGRFRDYFCRVVSNEALTMIRERKRRHEVPIAEDEDGNQMEFADTQAEASAQREYQMALLHEAFEHVKRELPPRQIQAFMAVRMDGVDPKKVSRMQRTSLATVYNDVTAVTAALRRTVATLDAE